MSAFKFLLVGTLAVLTVWLVKVYVTRWVGNRIDSQLVAQDARDSPDVTVTTSSIGGSGGGSATFDKLDMGHID